VLDFNSGSCKFSARLFLWVMVCFVVGLVSTFNIDTVHPLVYEDPAAGQNARESYFGYSLQFLFNQKDNAHNSAKWWSSEKDSPFTLFREIIAYCLSRLLVGAPRANSTFPSHANLKEPGQVYRCLLGNPNRDQCQPLIVESEGNVYEIAVKRYCE
jgi:hypothetical protein